MNREQLLDRVLSLGEEGDWAGVAELLREHLADFDDEPAVHCYLGVAERELGMEGLAYERFRRAIALGPDDPRVLATAGSGLAAYDDPEAEQALRTAALMAPHIATTRLLYGAYLAREGFHEEALGELRAARELEPDDPQIAYELGVALALAGDHDAAADTMADAARLDPEDGWVRTVHGLLLLETDRLEEGTGELVAGARLVEDDVDAQLLAALAAGASGRYDLAHEMLERGRLNAADEDVALVLSVEEHVDGGASAASAMLRDDLAPDRLRERLRERP